MWRYGCDHPTAFNAGRSGRPHHHFVTERLQRLPGVKDTFTIIAFKAFSPDTAM